MLSKNGIGKSLRKEMKCSCGKQFKIRYQNGIRVSKLCDTCVRKKERLKKKQLKEREKQRRVKKKEKKANSYKVVAKNAWDAFSIYIRTKHADWRGYLNCYTCGKIITIKQAQAGHCFHKGSGRYKPIDFDEDHIRPQDVGCNMFKGGKGSEFTLKLIGEHGIDKVEEMRRRRQEEEPLTIEELKEIESIYKNKLLSL